MFWVALLCFIFFQEFYYCVSTSAMYSYIHAQLHYIMYNYTKGSTFKSIPIIYHLTSVMNIMSILFANISSVNIYSYVFQPL